MIKISSNDRLYNLDIPIIALTGGIATGKSTVSSMFKDLGICIIDADQLIKTIYKLPETIDFIEETAPKCVHNKKIDFKALRQLFFTDKIIKEKIEAFLYKRLPAAFKNSISKDTKFVIYDVPLLFEKGIESKVDQVLLVYAPKAIQIQRLIKRDNISEELAIKIIQQQLDIESKKARSNFVINNSQDVDYLKKQFQEVINNLFIL